MIRLYVSQFHVCSGTHTRKGSRETQPHKIKEEVDDDKDDIKTLPQLKDEAEDSTLEALQSARQALAEIHKKARLALQTIHDLTETLSDADRNLAREMMLLRVGCPHVVMPCLLHYVAEAATGTGRLGPVFDGLVDLDDHLQDIIDAAYVERGDILDDDEGIHHDGEDSLYREGDGLYDEEMVEWRPWELGLV